MTRFASSPVRVAFLLALVGGVLPPVLYWAVVARVPTVSPQEVKDILAQPDAGGELVDVRTADEYAAGHLEAARSWPYAEIRQQTTAQGVPESLRGKRLFLICHSGILSGLAAQHLRSLGVANVANVEGGMQAWVAAADKPCTLGLCRIQTASGDRAALPLRESPLLEQAAAVLTGFFVKPLYTLLALVLVILLWRQPSPDLRALCWAMLAFFVGENCCAANYLMGSDQSLLLEYLHSYGMVLCFALTVYALFEGVDRRLLRLSDPDGRCAALGLCRRCIKQAPVPCGLRRVFAIVIPALILLALAPLCAELVPVSYNTKIFRAFYNYSHPVACQIFETRYLPIAAFLLLTLSLLALQGIKKDPVLWSKLFFAAGMGALGFSGFRLVLFQVYRDNLVWFGVWEELTELLFVLGTAVVLVIFREGLHLKLTPRRPSGSE